MSKIAGRCIFCGNGNLSKEHIFPNWIAKHLPKKYSHTGHAIIKDFRPLLNEKIQYGGKLHRQGDILTRKLRIVCRNCNNGWMSQLQTKVIPILKPLIVGDWKVLDLEQKEILSAWIVMTTMVLEFADTETVHISRQERFLFYKEPKPLPHWSIWIANYNGVEDRGFWHTAIQNYINLSTPNSKIESIAQITTFTLGKILCHAYSSTTIPVIFTKSYDYQLKLNKIFPIQEKQFFSLNPIDDDDAYRIATYLRGNLIESNPISNFSHVF